MPKEVITSLDQVTPEWLTAVLTRSNALTYGRVETFEVDTGQRVLSTSIRLNVNYTADSQGDRPSRLFLKLVNADQGDEFFGPSEVNFYARDYVGVQGVPLVRCYDAVYSAETLRYHILLDDLSETHLAATAKPPTLEHGLALAEGLAALHAHWWGEKRLVEGGAPLPTAEHIKRFVAIAEPGAERIIGRYPDELAPHWPELIREIYARHPQAMIERTQDGNGFSLIHGDAGLSNILVPREGDRPVYLIDRQPFDWSLTTWLAVYDLAFSVVLEWEVKKRREWERPILRHYHDHLLKNGVQDYSWEQLWDDYRLSAAMGVYIATEWCRGGIHEPYTPIWLPLLQNSLTACDDLDSRSLW